MSSITISIPEIGKIAVLLNHKQSPRVLCKKGVLRNFAKFTGKNLSQSLFFNKVAGVACNFIKKETLALVFSCEFCEISKTPLLTEHPWWLLLFNENIPN